MFPHENAPATPQKRLAGLARLIALISLICFAATLVAVRLSGVELSVAWWGMAKAAGSLGALFWAWRFLSRNDGNVRLRIISGGLFLILLALTVDVLSCSAGQTLARPLIDAQLQRADQWLGLDAEAFIWTIVSVPGLARLLQVAYLSSFPCILGTLIWFAFTKREERAWELCNVFSICLLLTVIGAVILPAVGAFHFMRFPEELRAQLPAHSGVYHLKFLFELRASDHFVIDPSHFGGVATFPSFHTALALMTAMAWRDTRPIFIPMILWQVAVLLSTIPIGGHYFIDLVAGAMCWAAAFGLCRWVARTEDVRDASPVSVSAPATALTAKDVPQMA